MQQTKSVYQASASSNKLDEKTKVAREMTSRFFDEWTFTVCIWSD